MNKKKKKNPPKLEVIENNVKHIKEKVDEISDQMTSVEKSLIQVSLNKQHINTLKNDVKNIHNIRIPKLKENVKIVDDELENKVNKKAFYVTVITATGVLVLVITILELVRIFLIK